jgi:hypothetical protein
MNSPEVRARLTEALRLDLIGPENDHAFASELLPQPPSRWYLTGFLVPSDAPLHQKKDEEATDEIDSGGNGGGADDESPPDRAPAKHSFMPSSMGLSVLVPAEVKQLQATVSWGDYTFESGASSEEEPVDAAVEETVDPPEAESSVLQEASTAYKANVKKGYRRYGRSETVSFPVPEPGQKPAAVEIPNSAGLVVMVTVRAIPPNSPAVSRLPAGTRSVSVFLVNRRQPNPERGYRAFAFQAKLGLKSEIPFVPRPDLRGASGVSHNIEWDERVADLHYRDVFEYAVGHGVSATSDGASGHFVETTWIPQAEVERVSPSSIPNVELGMAALGALQDGQDAKDKLSPLVQQYRAWTQIYRDKLASMNLESAQVETTQELLQNADLAATRIQAGIDMLSQPQVLDAFKIANRAMAAAGRQRSLVQAQGDTSKVPEPTWRPFQLAFILMTLRGMVDPTHADRRSVDLLFFPTGGGKTEAYLGLAAFTMVLRRLRHPGIRGAGVAVLMRYTLRLLTLDQLGRAASLMCALELERNQDKGKLGEWPFEIGLWVGSAATPNRMGHQGYTGPGADSTAYIKTKRFKEDSKRHPAPIPIEECPWCGTKFSGHCFHLVPNAKNPTNLRVRCTSHACPFSGDNHLPVLGVDEPIYRRLPAFLIATVDKFAALPWTGETGALFGLVDHHDSQGFYGPANPTPNATSLGGPLPPPDLVIQDELHLISGPLGTIAGVYETTIDALASRKSGGIELRPKIIASTATVRRATAQIRALFNRADVTIFPPPGPDRRDSFFAKTDSADETPARLYIGVAAPGKSLKVVLLRTSLALLGAAKTIYDAEGGHKNANNPADPYMTLLGYFNSLRELGGSRRIVEDEVRTRLDQYSRRRRRDPEDNLFANRSISYEVLELTSRVSTALVSEAKHRLSQPFKDKDSVDVALATNMISVGLDIVRLGLMVVLGQPKTSAEYIQATSRVGRDAKRPGFVVTLLNIHKPRDRSHYERFESYHKTFYRAVEATSVTPFSPRAMDRALAAALVGLCRHGNVAMTPAMGAERIITLKTQLDEFVQEFARRAEGHDAKLDAPGAIKLRDQVLHRGRALLDEWLNIASHLQTTGTHLQYQTEASGASGRLLHEFLNPELENKPKAFELFRANRSMRDVESSVDINVKNLNDW